MNQFYGLARVIPEKTESAPTPCTCLLGALPPHEHAGSDKASTISVQLKHLFSELERVLAALETANTSVRTQWRPLCALKLCVAAGGDKPAHFRHLFEVHRRFCGHLYFSKNVS